MLLITFITNKFMTDNKNNNFVTDKMIETHRRIVFTIDCFGRIFKSVPVYNKLSVFTSF